MNWKASFKTVGLIGLICLIWFKVTPALAIYDPLSVPNNKFGVHILEPAEIEKAAELVNSSGGEWGYATIPIRANDRNLPKWIKFMEETRRLRIIPILRIASFPLGDKWAAPNEWDLVDFANFLDELPWPTENRYIIIYNEPNHESEWGGFVSPSEYTRVLNRATDIFSKKSPDFFVISAGMDAAAPHSLNSLGEYEYFRQMEETVPGIFAKIDGFASHAYGNPGFATAPNIYSQINVANYRYEQDYLCRYFGACALKIFLTEAGWDSKQAGETKKSKYYQEALTKIWTDENLVTVTPFVLDAREGPFTGFSFIQKNGEWGGIAKSIMLLPKIKGEPKTKEQRNDDQINLNGGIDTTNVKATTGPPIVLLVVNFFRRLQQLFFAR